MVFACRVSSPRHVNEWQNAFECDRLWRQHRKPKSNRHLLDIELSETKLIDGILWHEVTPLIRNANIARTHYTIVRMTNVMALDCCVRYRAQRTEEKEKRKTRSNNKRRELRTNWFWRKRTYHKWNAYFCRACVPSEFEAKPSQPNDLSIPRSFTFGHNLTRNVRNAQCIAIAISFFFFFGFSLASMRTFPFFREQALKCVTVATASGHSNIPISVGWRRNGKYVYVSLGERVIHRKSLCGHAYSTVGRRAAENEIL